MALQVCEIYLRRDQSFSLRESYSSNEVKVFAPLWVKEAILQLSEHIKEMECILHDNADSEERVVQQKQAHEPVETFIFGEEIKKEGNLLRLLQKVARNESVNVSGRISKKGYQGVDKKIQLSIRDIVRQCVIVGVDYSSQCGGYRCPKIRQERRKVYICDLAALQFQMDHNTGRLVLIKDENTHEGLLDSLIYENVVGEKKKSFEEIRHKSSKGDKTQQRYIPVGGPKLKNVNCFIDTLAYRRFVKEDVILFGIAVCKIVEEFHPKDRIHLKFLKYGTGFFAGKVAHILEEHILLAVLDGLECLLTRKRTSDIIAKIELPFYSANFENEKRIDKLRKIHRVKIVLTMNDALQKSDEEDGLCVATTNCGDNHAACGNEMGYTSVDAAIAENLESKGNLFCPNINLKMGEEFIDISKVAEEPPEFTPETEPRVEMRPQKKPKKGPAPKPPTQNIVTSKKQDETETSFETNNNPPPHPQKKSSLQPTHEEKPQQLIEERSEETLQEVVKPTEATKEAVLTSELTIQTEIRKPELPLPANDEGAMRDFSIKEETETNKLSQQTGKLDALAPESSTNAINKPTKFTQKIQRFGKKLVREKPTKYEPAGIKYNKFEDADSITFDNTPNTSQFQQIPLTPEIPINENDHAKEKKEEDHSSSSITVENLASITDNENSGVKDVNK